MQPPHKPRTRPPSPSLLRREAEYRRRQETKKPDERPDLSPRAHDDYARMDAQVVPNDEFTKAEMWDEF